MRNVTLELSKIYSENGLTYTKEQITMSAVRKLAGVLSFDLTKTTPEQRTDIKSEVAAIINLDANAPMRLAYIFNPNFINEDEAFSVINTIFIYN